MGGIMGKSKEGSTKVSASENKPITTIISNNFRLIIGFEVNSPKEAFHCKMDGKKEICTQDLSGDYGHAFFYLCSGSDIRIIISFGPKYPVGLLDRMPARIDYPIREKTRLFNIPIGLKAYFSIHDEARRFANRVESNDELYQVWMNDTCAETAHDLVKEGWKNVPSGTGKVMDSSKSKLALNVINPYQWHRNFVKAGYKEYVLPANMMLWETIMYNIENNDKAKDPLVTMKLVKF